MNAKHIKIKYAGYLEKDHVWNLNAQVITRFHMAVIGAAKVQTGSGSVQVRDSRILATKMVHVIVGDALDMELHHVMNTIHKSAILILKFQNGTVNHTQTEPKF